MLALGIACFAALGIAISAAIPTADAAGAITNGTYLPLAMVSGMFSRDAAAARASLDTVVERVPAQGARRRPSRRLRPRRPGLPVGDAVVLAVWTVAGIVLARRFFRWEP